MPFNIAQIQSVGGFECIYADPAWRYKRNTGNGAAENHYPTMTVEEIAALPVRDITAKNCVLFMWATYPLLREALHVIDAWGFTYKTLGFQWVKHYALSGKEFFGQGGWSRGNTEPCFIAVKGKPKAKDHGVRQVISTYEYLETDEQILHAIHSGEHSEKPPEARARVERLVGDVLRLEMFSRHVNPGWDLWGNDVVSTVEFR